MSNIKKYLIKRKLFLHIGFAKTGTSTLQNYFKKKIINHYNIHFYTKHKFPLRNIFEYLKLNSLNKNVQKKI